MKMTRVESDLFSEMLKEQNPLLNAHSVLLQKEIEHKVAPNTYGSLSYLDLIAALKIFVLDPKIKAFLQENDPAALQQAENALKMKRPKNQQLAKG